MFSLLTNPGVVGKGTGVGLALQFENFTQLAMTFKMGY